MKRRPQNLVHIALATSTLTDAERDELVAGIQKIAPTSPLMQVQSIATSFGALGKKATTFKADNDAVAADRRQLQQDETARDLARAALDAELFTLKTLVRQNATSPTDVTSMGFQEGAPRVATTQSKPAVPGPVIVKPGKAAGRARVVIGTVGRLSGQTMAEVSPDPIATGSWTLLPGSGKQRRLSGPSGTRLWVRFAAVLYGQQSDWSTPVLVTLP